MFENVQCASTLTGLHQLTLAPKHLRERASTAGERLLHGRAFFFGVHRRSAFHTGVVFSLIFFFPPLSFSADLPPKSLHDLFLRLAERIFGFFSCL